MDLLPSVAGVAAGLLAQVLMSGQKACLPTCKGQPAASNSTISRNMRGERWYSTRV